MVLAALKFIVSQPVGRLISHIHKVRHAHDLGLRLNLHRHDEIGLLGDAFDDLLIKLSDSKKRLENQVEEKDALVQELRAALSEVKQLQRIIPHMRQLQECPGRRRILATGGGIYFKPFRSAFFTQHLSGLREKAVSGNGR